MKKTLWSAAFVAAWAVSGRAMADAECTTTVGREDVVRCALRASLAVRSEAQRGEALEGRRVAASAILPANPVLAFSAARRNSDTARATNWSATLSQEIEIAGQRSARQRAAELAKIANRHRVSVARRDTGAVAWIAYFDALAADDEVRLARKLASDASQIALVARGMAERGLLSGVEADVADAAQVSVEQAVLSAERRGRDAQAAFATILGFDPTRAITVRGDLVPLRGVEEEARAALGTDMNDRDEVRVHDAERRAEEATALALARARVPNPTLSLFVENDGFDERVLGAGVSLPIPMPQPLGRFHTGEIAEAKALARQATTDAERARRQARTELLSAMSEYDMRRRQRDVLTAERIRRAEQDIDAIAKELIAGRIPVRDALVAQQALVGLLRADLEARRALCAASVELARAAGISFERGTR